MPFLDPHLAFSVLAGARSDIERHEELGCGLQGPQSRPVRRALGALKARIARMGRAAAIARAEELLTWLDDRPGMRALCHPTRKIAGRRALRTSVLYPTPLPPRLLHVRRGEAALEVPLQGEDFPDLGDALAALAAGAAPSPRRPAVRELFSELGSAGLIAAEGPRRLDSLEDGAFFLGHNTVLISSGKTRVLVDPWFRPWHPGDPPRYRPVLPSQLPPPDAIALTHSHGDHFHLGSLLHLSRSTPVFVPALARETVLATDMALRLRQLGFTDVRRLPWGQSARIGDARIEAVPFYGEQPTTQGVVYPLLRNQGNTYVVRTPKLSVALLADSGRDRAGDMLQAAVELRRRSGAVDVAFAGARSFRLHPILYPFTTLDAFLLDVPLDLAGVEMQLMNDADDALDVAEAMGARTLVPYADGGAPWYWREGMGPSYRGYPHYPGEREPAGTALDDPRSDPFPERVADRAAARYGGPGPVEVRVLRPGDLLRGGEVVRFPGLAWPYGGRPSGTGRGGVLPSRRR